MKSNLKMMIFLSRRYQRAPFIKNYPQKIYVLENCCGNIFLITRKLDVLDTTFTTEVKVYRCNEEGNTWDQVKSLDGQAFFCRY